MGEQRRLGKKLLVQSRLSARHLVSSKKRFSASAHGQVSADSFVAVKTKVGNVLERWALSRTKAPSDLVLGHRYVRLHGWSPDSKKALVSISGHEGKWQIPGWFAIYNFDTGMLTFDLGEFNH